MDTASSMLIRITKGWKERLGRIAEELNRCSPGARYSAHSIALDAIIARVEKIEKELKKEKVSIAEKKGEEKNSEFKKNQIGA